jgi:predicted 2-oxoglutarate/Fe(II)-dependent dioxygenase YbiX
LSVDSVGAVAFPVTAKIAKSLIVEAEPARYGLKDKTLLDRQVRDTWEIPKSRIQTNQAWEAQLYKSLQKIQKDLNLPEDGKLTSDLHNLLIYMPGQFFKAHQDSEKTDGMLATLVIILPSEFTGGELVIDQHGDRKIIEFSESASKSLTFVAFYADCYHEVKEVKSGYRLALTYNLFFRAGSKTLEPHRNVELEKAVQIYFSQIPERKRAYEELRPQWLVYLLDHEYTQNSLDWNLLRGLDRERAGEFLACADHLGLTAHLALADIHETWSTEGDDWGWRGRRHWRYDEDDEDADIESSEYRLTELIQDEIVLRHWIARSGKRSEEWDKYVPRQMVCWTKAVDEFKPFKSEHEGYMGNYGNTLDRWYHRAAIILWKKESDLISLFTCDRTEALRSIGEILKNDLSRGHQAIRQILPYWPTKMHRFVDPIVVLEFANVVQDEDLATTLVKTVGIGSLTVKSLPSLMKLMESYGEDWLIPILNSWREDREWDKRDSIAKELPRLVMQLAPNYKKISHWLLQDQLSLLIRGDLGEEKHLNPKLVRQQLPQKLQTIETLLKACRLGGETELHDKLAEHVIKRQLLYPEVELVKLFLALDKTVYAQVLMKLAERLKRQASAPRKEGDWSIREDVPYGGPRKLDRLLR